MKYIINIFTIVIFLYSCSNEDIIQKEIITDNKNHTHSRSTTNNIIYDTLKNPYEISHIKNVAHSAGGDSSIYSPNKLYVRFLPKDTSDINQLANIDSLELFDYPLNIDFGEDEEYIPIKRDSNDLFSWKYTTVPIDYYFRPIEYEIIERCYIPEENETIANSRNQNSTNLEELAFLSLGYEIDTTNESRSAKHPKGYVTFDKDNTNTKTPIKGVKIRCHTFVKWSTTFTDENGRYEIDNKFLIGPHYAVVFDNKNNFGIYKNWGPIAKANFNGGWHNKKGHDMHIKASSKLWSCAVINNAGFEYYKMCDSLKIETPPKNLVIWAYNNIPSCAPMLNQNKDFITVNGDSYCGNFFTNLGLIDIQLNPLMLLLRAIAPDIVIKTNSDDYKTIYKNTFHELAHASHYSVVGDSFWSKYISYIITYGRGDSYYGDGSGYNSELCAIGEMWGYFIGYSAKIELESSITSTMEYPGNKYWFSPEVYWNLYKNKILTKKEIFQCMKPGIQSYEKLLNELRYYYPGKTYSIEKEFYNNEIATEHLTINFNETIQSLYIPNDRVIYGGNLVIRDGFVTNNSLLEIGASESTTICAPFTVSAGSAIIIY